MPVFSRKGLRRKLAGEFVRDMPLTLWVNMAGNQASGATPVAAFNSIYANTDYSGQELYKNGFAYIEGSTNSPDTAGTFYEYLIGSFNPGSGAFISGARALTSHNGNSIFEIHTRLSPYLKEAAINDTIKRARLRQEVGIPTTDGAVFYDIDGCASPYTLDRILDVHVLANPNSSLDRDLRHVDDWQVVTTGSGQELRLRRAIMGSQQLVFDAILIPTLGGELATINLPDDRWILAGAAMRCYDFLIQDSPGQQVTQLQQRRADWAAEYTRLSAKFMPTYESPVRFHEVLRGSAPQVYDTTWW